MLGASDSGRESSMAGQKGRSHSLHAVGCEGDWVTGNLDTGSSYQGVLKVFDVCFSQRPRRMLDSSIQDNSLVN